MSWFYMYFWHSYLVYSSSLSFPQFSAITKLNGTNYKCFKNRIEQCIEKVTCSRFTDLTDGRTGEVTNIYFIFYLNLKNLKI